jgi:FKBP-type peptidyl-prolyl cis-trans isomerase 2
MTDPEFIRLTYQMRQAQTRFFRSRDEAEKRSALRESKRLEQLVDKELRDRAPEVDDARQFQVAPEAAGGSDVATDDGLRGPSEEELSA